jgi:two-component sensor histidine kinase
LSKASRAACMRWRNALVRRSFSDAAPEGKVDIGEVIASVLRPYRERSSRDLPWLGERAVNNIALVFHELATIAAKYGALTVDSGRVAVDWQIHDGMIALTWKETGGP